jgi:hypothetical protein
LVVIHRALRSLLVDPVMASPRASYKMREWMSNNYVEFLVTLFKFPLAGSNA